MWSKTFIKQCAERMLKTFAQVLAAMLGADGLGVLNANWGDALSVAAMAAVLSVLTSVASAPLSPQGSPSLVDATPGSGQQPSRHSERTATFESGRAAPNGDARRYG